MTNYKNTIAGSSVALLVGLFSVLAFVPASVAHAADLDLGWYPESIDSYSPFSGGDSGWYPESIDSYTPYSSVDSGWYPESIDSYSSPSYSYAPYGGSSFFSGGWTPSFYTGGGYYGGYSAPGYTNVNTNVNTNTCTNGSCNTAINAPTNIVNNPSPTVVYSQPSYPVYQPPVYIPQTPSCYTCGCAGYPACARPIAYQNQPYVTLAAVPYTGLELGPVGTALYWGFLVLWCLIAAYLIAVKKIQNKIAAWFTGSTPSHTAHAVHSTPAHVAPVAHAAPAASTEVSGIDPFILSQINRAK